MNLMSCNIFLKNENYVVKLKCPKRMLEYYLSRVFNILDCNVNNLEKLRNEIKHIIHAEETDNSDKVMTCNNIFTSKSNILKNSVVNKSFSLLVLKENSMIKRK